MEGKGHIDEEKLKIDEILLKKNELEKKIIELNGEIKLKTEKLQEAMKVNE